MEVLQRDLRASLPTGWRDDHHQDQQESASGEDRHAAQTAEAGGGAVVPTEDTGGREGQLKVQDRSTRAREWEDRAHGGKPQD